MEATPSNLLPTGTSEHLSISSGTDDVTVNTALMTKIEMLDSENVALKHKEYRMEAEIILLGQ